MITIKNEATLFVDVDQTLVLWRSKNPNLTIIDPYDGEELKLEIVEAHVKLIKRAKGRGRTVIVWSHGGCLWAEAVVKAIGIEEYVDYCMTKVEDYVDDLDIGQWITKNIFQKNYGGGE